MQGNEVAVPAVPTNYFDAYPVNVGVMTMLGTTAAQRYVLPRVKDERWAWMLEINPSLASLPTIGEDASASAEEVLSIEPEFVVVNNKGTADEYRQAGLIVFAVTANDSGDYLDAVDKSAELFGGEYEEKAEAYRECFESNFALVAERVADAAADERRRVYYVSGKTPYNTETGGRGMEIVADLGGTFAVEVEIADGKAVEATAEQILSADPDVIIVGNNTRAAAYKALMQDEALSSLAAVQAGEVYVTPQGIVPWDIYGPEYALLPLWLGKTLYPDLFSDVDLKQEAADFYARFFDYELSDAYAELMLAGATGPEGD